MNTSYCFFFAVITYNNLLYIFTNSFYLHSKMHLFVKLKRYSLIFSSATTVQKLVYLVLLAFINDIGLVKALKEPNLKKSCWTKPKTAYFYLRHQLRSKLIEFVDFDYSNGEFALVGGLLPTKLKFHYFVCDSSLAISMNHKNTTKFLTASPLDRRAYFTKGSLKKINKNDPRLFYYYFDWMSDKRIFKNKFTGLFLRFKELQPSYMHVMELTHPRLATDVCMNRYIRRKNK